MDTIALSVHPAELYNEIQVDSSALARGAGEPAAKLDSIAGEFGCIQPRRLGPKCVHQLEAIR